MNGFDISTISELYVGSTPYSAIYKGSTLLWQARLDYSKEYFTIESLTNSNNAYYYNGYTTTNNIEWSKDKISWTSVVNDGSTNDILITTLNKNEKVYIRGINTTYSNGSNFNKFYCGGDFKVYGNIMSLIYGSNFENNNSLSGYSNFTALFYLSNNLVDASNLILPSMTLTAGCYANMFYGCKKLTLPPQLPATTLHQNCYQNMFSGCTKLTAAPSLPALFASPYCYQNMFRGCTSLTVAPELPATEIMTYCYYYMFYGCTKLTAAPELPATTLASYCYYGMFYNCDSLTTAPALPATTLANYCYGRMFQACDRLTTAPKSLPATTLANYCYQYMFSGCTKLTAAPELPATTLVTGCYDSMFYFCSSLKYVKAMFTNYSSDYTNNWLGNVSSTGTFVKNINATISTGASGIPSGWTIETVAA